MKLKLSCDMPTLREQAKRRVMDSAIAMLKKLTIIDPVQSQIYAEKLAQAEAYIATKEAGSLLTNEASIRGISIDDLANCVIKKADCDKRLRTSVELQRSAVNAQIDAALTPSQIEIASTIVWKIDG